MTPNNHLGAETIWRWRASPRLMALELFGFVPDPWQGEALDAFAHSPRIAMKSCKGQGKSSILAILAWNFLLCYPHSIAGATSINAPNLYSNLWVELARWKAKARAKGNLLEGMFETTTKEIRHREGIVTLSKRRREAGLPYGTSSGLDDLAPRGHRRGGQYAVRLS